MSNQNNVDNPIIIDGDDDEVNIIPMENNNGATQLHDNSISLVFNIDININNTIIVQSVPSSLEQSNITASGSTVNSSINDIKDKNWSTALHVRKLKIKYYYQCHYLLRKKNVVVVLLCPTWCSDWTHSDSRKVWQQLSKFDSIFQSLLEHILLSRLFVLLLFSSNK